MLNRTRPTRQLAVAICCLYLVTPGLLFGQQPPASNPAEQAAPGAAEKVAIPANPFTRKIPVPDFPKGMEWINTKPLSKADLKGKFVILDFWTYCCINCIHILPELKKLEEKYPESLVVIGVHSAKFETEKDADNIREAVLRYEVVHPVVNDDEHRIWNLFGVSSWPTMLLLDPEGNAVYGRSGEFEAEQISAILDKAIPHYRATGALDEKPIRFELEKFKTKPTPLRFPGKVLADEKSNRLFIADSNHNRIVVTTLAGELLQTIGSGEIGLKDGSFSTAQFNKPQGMALRGDQLYVADTKNHAIRLVDLKEQSVNTLSGTGEQSRNAWPGLNRFSPELPERFVMKAAGASLGSPWAVWLHKDDLYIAMAGPHQIWKMKLDGSEIGPYAGNGREDLVDGKLLPKQPYDNNDYSSFAQPSGLTSDGTWLYIADSESSSIRAVPFDANKRVKTVVGPVDKPFGRLFEFGDTDGPGKTARLQHALGVVHVDGNLYLADTYNNKIKVADATTGETKTLLGGGQSKPGFSDAKGLFDEPAGISYASGKLYVADTNNHAIRVVNLDNNQVETLEIAALAPPKKPRVRKKPSFKGATLVSVPATSVKATDGKVTLAVTLKLPKDWKINELAPMSYWIESVQEKEGVAQPLPPTRVKLSKPQASFEVPVTVSGEGNDKLAISMNYYYCQKGDEGLCKVGSVVFTVPITVSDAATATKVPISFDVKP